MQSQAAFASPYPPQVGSRLLVALARALSARPEDPGAAQPLPWGRPADTRQVALALRDTCRVVAADLAKPPAPLRAGRLTERLTATASEIGDVLALFDRTTEQMRRLAADALAAAPGTGAVEDGLTIVASEVRTLSQQTRWASQRVARQVEAMQGAASRPGPGGRLAERARGAIEMDWSEPGTAAARPPAPPPAQGAAADRAEGEFSLLAWLSRDAETPDASSFEGR